MTLKKNAAPTEVSKDTTPYGVNTGDNPNLLNQDCDRKLFRWFLERVDVRAFYRYHYI